MTAVAPQEVSGIEEPLCREECYRQPRDAMGRRLGPAEAQGV